MINNYLKKQVQQLALVATLIVAALTSCKKTEVITLSAAKYESGAQVKPGNICGSIKGVILSDSVYNVTCDIVVNRGDTLIIQPGAKIYIQGKYTFWIKGNLASLGTQDKPIYFTVPGIVKKDIVGQDVTLDPAYTGLWGGIQSDSSTQFMIIKYTHIEFAGATIVTGQVEGVGNGARTKPLRFNSLNGMYVLEDSWLYGSTDVQLDAAKGRFHIMRNIFEKSGYKGGEAMQCGNGSWGNIAYNLFIGAPTNAIRVSNGNGLLSPQVNPICYNNTMLNGGYRRAIFGGEGRGASIGFESQGRGEVYNNLFVDNKNGLRIVKDFSYNGNLLFIADTAKLKYSNNYFYGDAVELTEAFYPVNCLAKPLPTNIPLPSTFLPANYQLGDAYNGSSLVGLNDPQFVNYPLPIVYPTPIVPLVTVPKLLSTMAFKGNYDFHLKPTSPCIGKGTTNFIISAAVTKTGVFGATEITPPGRDMGCYQLDGTGMKN